jgi:formyl-CoA transferase
VPASSIYTAKDIAEDPHYRARGMIQRTRTRAGYEVDLPGIVPKLSLTPGVHRCAAPELGADTAEVLRRLGFAQERLAELSAKGIIEMRS